MSGRWSHADYRVGRVTGKGLVADGGDIAADIDVVKAAVHDVPSILTDTDIQRGGIIKVLGAPDTAIHISAQEGVFSNRRQGCGQVDAGQTVASGESEFTDGLDVVV